MKAFGLAPLTGLIFGMFLGAQANEPVPPGYESYENRPRIETVNPETHVDLPASWRELRRGHLEAAIQIIELYPDRQIYFLARDSELLFDTARILYADEPNVLSRIHLLNVSRANMKDPHLTEYLAQEGISSKEIDAGKRVLFVDTGFAGTIPAKIQANFPNAAPAAFRTHLLCSANESHPSTRVFLSSLNPAASRIDPARLHGTVLDYEFMPRFMARSETFWQSGHRWHPLSRVGSDSFANNDGKVSPSIARKYMEDLSAYLRTDAAIMLSARRKEMYRKILALEKTPAVLSDYLRTILGPPEKLDPYSEGLVRDYIEATSRNRAPSGDHAEIDLHSLGLEEVKTAKRLSKLEVMEKYPAFSSLLSDPATEIPAAFARGDLATLGALFDTYADEETSRILIAAIGTRPTTASLNLFVQALLENGDEYPSHELAKSIFTRLDAWETGIIEAALLKARRPPANAFLENISEWISRPDASRLFAAASKVATKSAVLDVIESPYVSQIGKKDINSALISVVEGLNRFILFKKRNWLDDKNAFDLGLRLAKKTLLLPQTIDLVSPMRLYFDVMARAPGGQALLDRLAEGLKHDPKAKGPAHSLFIQAAKINEVNDPEKIREFLDRGFARLSPRRSVSAGFCFQLLKPLWP